MFAVVLSVIYVYTLYNIPVMVAGVRHLRLLSQKKGTLSPKNEGKLPKVSILVPVKNEEKVIGRLLRALLNLDYPLQKMEIIIVNDGSTDKTVEICEEYAMRYPDRVKLLHRSTSDGKPSALNYGLRHAKGEIVATFDADNVPGSDVLLKAVKFFEDPLTAAVQGTICSINADENTLTKFLSYEEAVRYRVYLQGKDVLKLFVHLAGTCQFIRRSALDEVGGWNKESMTEDIEISAKLVGRGYNIRYVSDIRSWQENPVNVTQLVNQRARWYRGCLETALRYGRLLRKPNRRNIDAEITLTAPCTLTLSFVGFLIGLFASLFPIPYDPVFTFMAQLSTFSFMAILLIVGFALIYVTKPRRIRNLVWLPFIYGYWMVQTFIASYAFIQVVFRRPRKWKKTVRTGVVTNHDFESSS